jgi:hypothetical protein
MSAKILRRGERGVSESCGAHGAASTRFPAPDWMRALLGCGANARMGVGQTGAYAVKRWTCSWSPSLTTHIPAVLARLTLSTTAVANATVSPVNL